MLFHKLPKVGVLTPMLAEVCLKLMSWKMFRICFFLGVIRYLRLRTTLRMTDFLASPLNWGHSFFGLFRGKIWNMSKWGPPERQQRQRLSKMVSIQLSTSKLVCPGPLTRYREIKPKPAERRRAGYWEESAPWRYLQAATQGESARDVWDHLGWLPRRDGFVLSSTDSTPISISRLWKMCTRCQKAGDEKNFMFLRVGVSDLLFAFEAYYFT